MLIGIDIVDIERIEIAANRSTRFLSRVYTPGELQYCLQKKNPYPSLAARFAAKEAFLKLDPLLMKTFRFHDLEILPDAYGAPQLKLYAGAYAMASRLKLTDISISLSHGKKQAIAAVIARKE